MLAKTEPIIIKKYANRRLYNTGTSTYVTLEDVAGMVKRNDNFFVQDAKSGDDITHQVLTQIIFDLENRKGQNMLPVSFLRQLIAFYGDQMQVLVSSFLEQSMLAFSREQERFRSQMKSALSKSAGGIMTSDATKPAASLKGIEEQTRRNLEVLQNAMTMFSPLPVASNANNPASAEEALKARPNELQELKEQIAAMQRKIDAL